MKVSIFLIPLSIKCLNPKLLGFLFFSRYNFNWGVKCEKLNFRKSWGIYLISFENRTRIEWSFRNFQPSSSYRIFYVIFASSNRYFSENSRWVPLYYNKALFKQSSQSICIKSRIHSSSHTLVLKNRLNRNLKLNFGFINPVTPYGLMTKFYEKF